MYEMAKFISEFKVNNLMISPIFVIGISRKQPVASIKSFKGILSCIWVLRTEKPLTAIGNRTGDLQVTDIHGTNACC